MAGGDQRGPRWHVRVRVGGGVCGLGSTGATSRIYIHHMLVITQQSLSIEHQCQEAVSHLGETSHQHIKSSQSSGDMTGEADIGDR